jgi:16S rRNA (guanine1516-N2)-methyltransferase
MTYKPEVTLAPSLCSTDAIIAEQHGIRAVKTRDSSSWQLVRSGANMTLCAPDDEGGYSIRVDVIEGPMARRIRTARRTDPLPRAIGLHRRRSVSVLDATAGLGRDSMVLAHLGCTLISVERVPALCLLLQLAVEDLGAEIEVIHAEAEQWMAARPKKMAPDAILLDPMFTQPSKSQVKKEMQACRALANHPVDEVALLRSARDLASDRVVVKRHPNSDPIAPDVSHSVDSGRVRFDVYLTND